MQKVESSSLFIRFTEGPGNGAFVVTAVLPSRIATDERC